MKLRLCRSSWRAFASTHPLMFPSTSPMEVLFSCPSSPSWNLPSFNVESTLSSPCSRLYPLSLDKGWFSLTLTLSHHTIWCSGQTALFLFPLAKTALVYLPTALLETLKPLSTLRQVQYVQVSVVSTLFFTRTQGILSHVNCSTPMFPRFPQKNLYSLVTHAVCSLVFAATDTAYCSAHISLGLAESRILLAAPADTRARNLSSHFALPSYELFAPLALWRLSVSLQPLVLTLGSYPAYGAPRFSGMPHSSEGVG